MSLQDEIKRLTEKEGSIQDCLNQYNDTTGVSVQDSLKAITEADGSIQDLLNAKAETSGLPIGACAKCIDSFASGDPSGLAKNAGTVAAVNNSESLTDWASAGNALSNDSDFATLTEVKAADIFNVFDNRIMLLDTNSETQGDNMADEGTGWLETEALFVYGGETDKWSSVLTPELVNTTTFGFDFRVRIWDVNSSYSTSDVLRFSNFNFNIPENATIDGVEVSIYKKCEKNGTSGTAYINTATMQVYYS